jgi:hypothetical protein
MLGGGEYLHKQNSFRVRLQRLKKKDGRVRLWDSAEHLVFCVRRSERAADHIYIQFKEYSSLTAMERKEWGRGFLPYLEEKRSDGSPPIHSSS